MIPKEWTYMNIHDHHQTRCCRLRLHLACILHLHNRERYRAMYSHPMESLWGSNIGLGPLASFPVLVLLKCYELTPTGPKEAASFFFAG